MHARFPTAFCLILTATAAALVSVPTRAQQTNQSDPTNPPPERWESDIAAFESWDAKNAIPVDPVLFVGSSSIRMWPSHACFPDLPVINRGFGGSHISDVNHFADRIVLPYAPRVIVFYAGDNDVAAGKTPQRVADDYRTFVSLVHAKRPATTIIYIPIKPSLSRWATWPQMREANDMIREFSSASDHLFYADTASPMLGEDGTPRRELFLDDGLHLNEAGYRLWTRVLTPVLNQALSAAKSGGAGTPRQQPQRVLRTITKNVEINYLLYLPPEYEQDHSRRWPLVLFLHGAGERGDDLEKVKSHGPARYIKEGKDYPFVVVAPQCPADQWWDSDVILSLLDYITSTLRIDLDRVYLTGLSMGGFGTWHTAAQQPDRFAAIVPICGGGSVADAEKLKSLPIWAFHGEKDPVVPPERSKEMVEAVNAAGGHAKLTLYPEAGHDSWTETYENPELYKWLLSHRRGENE